MESKEEIINKIDEINERIWNLRATPNDDHTSEETLNEALAQAKEIDYTFGVARCTLNLGMGAFIIKHDKELSVKLLNEALELFKEQKNAKWISNAMLTQAIIINSTGSPESALYHALKGIEFYEKNVTDKRDIAMAYYVIGTVYKDLKKYDEAEAYYLKGIVQDQEQNSWSARIHTGLSNIYNERGDFHKALQLTIGSIEILKKENNKVGESRALNDIGIIYRKLKNYTKALEYLNQGLELRKSIKLLHFVLGSHIEIAETYLEMNELENALKHFQLAEPIAVETKHESRLSGIYNQIANIEKKLGHYESAISYFEKLIQLNETINKKEKENKVSELQNTLLNEKVQEIERLKNVELKNAYELISEKNKEILDSIHYAKRIQNALLASQQLLSNHLKEHFVLFEPKDIVSGDFYWATKKDDRFYLAVCDSTGHGVPGAFMSLLNITFLNEAITEKGITEPHLIFNHVRERIIQTISKDGAQDGMDGILICIKENDPIVTYAAANNALVIAVSFGANDLYCDKMPVGKGENNASFRSYQVELKKGDTLYLLTDGFADQFGGVKGKKFKHKNLIEKIGNIHDQNLIAQHTELKNTFLNWKGDLEQVDDVCIIGIKL